MNKAYLTQLADALTKAVAASGLEQADHVDTVVRRVIYDFLEHSEAHNLVTFEEMKEQVQEILEDELPDFEDFVKVEDLEDAVDWQKIIGDLDLVESYDLDGLVRAEDLHETFENYVKEAVQELETTVSTETNELAERLEQLEAVNARCFFGRLKWLITGK